ncbi:hypothetical protein LZ30DRAFT_781392 [Colletotrichum cereale]|nr:hypothetical protein LZ30DRAFT_781392 [Colletotrichum cereale]
MNDLGPRAGTYRDENDQPWILPSARLAKESLGAPRHEYIYIARLKAVTIIGSLPGPIKNIKISIDRGGRFTDCVASVPGQDDVLVKLLSVELSNYPDAPIESIRRVLEKVTREPSLNIMSRTAKPEASPPEQESSRQEESKSSKKEKRRLRKLQKNTERADTKPEIVEHEQLEGPADANATVDHGSESEWEGFPDPPAPAAHFTAAVSEPDTGGLIVVYNETTVVEGKNGVSALQQSIAHQFPGSPRPATHALTDLLDGPALRGLAAPSQPDVHTVHQLALATRLWFDEHRGKKVHLGVVRKNKDPIIDMSGRPKGAILWIRSIDGNLDHPDRKPTRFCGVEAVPAEIRLHEKEYAKTNGGRH